MNIYVPRADCPDSAYGGSSCDEHTMNQLLIDGQPPHERNDAHVEPTPEIANVTKTNLLENKSFYWRNRNFRSISHESVDQLFVEATCDADTAIASESDTTFGFNESNVTVISVKRPAASPNASPAAAKGIGDGLGVGIAGASDDSSSDNNACRLEARNKRKAMRRRSTEHGVRRLQEQKQKRQKQLFDGGGDADGVDADDDFTPPASPRLHYNGIRINTANMSIGMLLMIGYVLLRFAAAAWLGIHLH